MARKMMKDLVVGEIITKYLLPSQIDIETYVNQKVNSLIASM